MAEKINKTLDELIYEFRDESAALINNTRLPISVVLLLVRELENELTGVAQQIEQEINAKKQKEKENAEK